MTTTAMGTRNALGFAAGEFGANLTWNMISGFILFYYSNVMLLPVAAIGTMLLATRVLDAVIDPAIGIAVDRTNTRWGRARPYLFAATLPFVVVTVLTFSVPDWSADRQLIYAYVTFTLAGILFSLLYIPYNAMLPLLTSDPAEKLRISSYRAIAAAAGSIVMYSSLMYLVNTLGRGNQRMGFSLTSAVMGLATALSMLLVFVTTRERPIAPGTQTHHPLQASIGGMLRNPAWLMVAAYALFLFIRLGSMVSATAFFAVDVLHKAAAISWLFSSLSVAILIGGYLAKPFLARTGLRAGNLLSLSFAIVLTLAMALSTRQIWLFAVFYFLANMSIGIQSTTMFVLAADSVDAQQQLYGHRAEGMLTSAVSFATKVGMALGGSVVAYGLAFASYRPDAVSEVARFQIQLMYFGMPALFALAQMVIVSLYKPIAPASGA